MIDTLPSSPQEPRQNLPRSPQKPRRKLVSDKKRKRAALLEQRLIWIQDKYSGLESDLRDLATEFPEADFAEIIRVAARALPAAVEEAHKIAARDRKNDRNAVLKVLESWECVTLEEIVEDTGLSRWTVWNILQDLHRLKLILITQQSAHSAEGKNPSLLYGLKH